MAIRSPTVLGVDGAARGWVGVRWDGVMAVPLFEPTLAVLCTQAGAVDAIAIDMPIGLGQHDRRDCDAQARVLLGPRRSSLFAPPVLAALAHEAYGDANRWSKETTGRGISKQAWMLVPKIREVRALAERTDLPLHESFPELSFLALNGDVPLSHPKRTWNGMAARLELLRGVRLEPPVDAGPAGAVAADDLIDAAALAWSAARIASGTARCLPAAPGEGEPSIWW